MIQYIKNNPWFLVIIALILMIPALTVNLGLNPVFLASDEAIRALVSTEMILSGDYVVPTIQGELYLKKPPLYNWIIAGSFQLFNSYDELILRIPNLIFFLLSGLVIFLSFRKTSGNYKAALIALMFMTSGRLLFWDSFIGLIDIMFSMFIFLNFIVIYKLFHKNKLLAMFLISYLLTAIAFMLKGLPALVFQALTLLIIFIMNKQFMKLISWKHIAGIMLLAILLGSYYLTYYFSRPGATGDLFYMLFEQSARRTGIRFGFLQTILHFFTFPLDVVYHFAPWTLFAVFLFRKDFLRRLKEDNFIFYLALVFIVNIVVYWISPEVFPRYLFMFIPLLLAVIMYFEGINEKDVYTKTTGIIMLVVMITGLAAFAAAPFTEYFSFVEARFLKSGVVVAALAFFIFLFTKIKHQRIAIMIIALLVMRTGYNWYILPDRARNTEEFRENAVKVASITKGERLYVYRGSVYQHAISFYLSANRGEIVEVKHNNFDPDAFYMVYPYMLEGREYINYLDFEIEWNRRHLKLVKFTDRDHEDFYGQ